VCLNVELSLCVKLDLRWTSYERFTKKPLDYFLQYLQRHDTLIHQQDSCMTSGNDIDILVGVVVPADSVVPLCFSGGTTEATKTVSVADDADCSADWPVDLGLAGAGCGFDPVRVLTLTAVSVLETASWTLVGGTTATCDADSLLQKLTRTNEPSVKVLPFVGRFKICCFNTDQ